MNKFTMGLMAINTTALAVEIMSHLTQILVALVLLLNALYSAYELYVKFAEARDKRNGLSQSETEDSKNDAET